MAEALVVLASQGHRSEHDLDPPGERLLGEHVRKIYGHEFVFVTDYPISVRPFYHMRYAEHPGLTKSFDLLWNGLEITTGAQREHRPDILEKQAIEKGLNPEGIRFYLDFFTTGCPPHGGFGFGLARMLMVMLGLPNVRETTFLPRTPNRLQP
jgi:aspartyl-tRNA synthetase